MNGLDLTDDRILVAYADGELGVMDALAVEAALDRDPALREKLRILREAGALLRDAYRPILDEPVPTALTALIDAAPVMPGYRPVNDNNASYRRRAATMRFITRAAAALMLVLAGAAAGWLAAGERAPSQIAAGEMDPVMQAAATRLVQRTLENLVSGSSNVWRDPRSDATLAVTPVRTFKDSDDRYCREFRETVSRGGEQTLLRIGIACRDGKGQWNARFYVVPGADPPRELVSF